MKFTSHKNKIVSQLLAKVLMKMKNEHKKINMFTF